MKQKTLNTFAFTALTVGILAASGSVSAHTRLQTNTVVEGTRVYNNATIGHGCAPAVIGAPESPVIANSIVFPDGTDSTIKDSAGNSLSGTVDDYISWGGSIFAHIPSKDVFSNSVIEYGRAGFAGRLTQGPVGNHSWNGKLPGNDNVGLVPFRISTPVFPSTSCAKSVTFRVAIADICKVTNVAGMNDLTVNLWTPAVGSKFDGKSGDHGYNSPATYKITRDLTKNPIDEANCGAGLDVVVDPSAAQLDHDLPIPGVWPSRK